jgi:hypothetical protein
MIVSLFLHVATTPGNSLLHGQRQRPLTTRAAPTFRPAGVPLAKPALRALLTLLKMSPDAI